MDHFVWRILMKAISMIAGIKAQIQIIHNGLLRISLIKKIQIILLRMPVMKLLIPKLRD